LLANAAGLLHQCRLTHRNREQAHSYNFRIRIQNPRRTGLCARLKIRAERKSTVGAIGGYDGRESGGSVTSMPSDTPPSRASSRLQFMYPHPKSASNGFMCPHPNQRRTVLCARTQIRVERKSPVGAIGGYDGREGGGSVTSMPSDTPPSRASSLLQFMYPHPKSASNGFMCPSQNPRRTQIHCRSNRRLRRSRKRRVCDIDAV
jgi:hypothetical protein